MPLPWSEVNAVASPRVADALGLIRAPSFEGRRGRKWACVACDSSDALHAHAGSGKTPGFKCYSCGRSWSNVDLAADRLGLQPVDACKELANRLGILVLDDRPARRVHPIIHARTAPQPRQRAAVEEWKSGSNSVITTDPEPADAATWEAEVAEIRAEGASVQEPAAIYTAVLRFLDLTERGAEYLVSRGMDHDIAAEYGFRSIDPLEWKEVEVYLQDSFLTAELIAAGWFKREEGHLRGIPLMRKRGSALLLPIMYRGRCVGMRFRALAPRTPKKWRYLSLFGSQERTQPLPFNADALRGVRGQELHIVEGELNAYTLHCYGLRAIGLPGAGNWRSEWTKIVQQAGRLVAWFDNDPAGHRGAGRLAAELEVAMGGAWLRTNARSMRTPADVNDLHQQGTLHERIERAAWRD